MEKEIFAYTGVQEDEFGAAPSLFDLQQNMPNPFYQETDITFQIPVAARTAVTVHDLSGRLVRVLVHEARKPGRYSVVWDGRDDSGRMVASGIYFYRLKAVPINGGERGHFDHTRKLTFVK